MTTIVRIVLIVIAFWIVTKACGGSDSPKTYESSNAIGNSDALNDSISVDVGDIEPESWGYSEDEDRMTSVKNFYASSRATSLIDFDFPYNGGSQFTLFVRKMGGKRSEIVLQCDKCQFIHSYGEDNYVKVKFDDRKPERYSFNTAADGSSDIIFIEGASRFIANLKKSKHVLIGADFYQAGTKYMDFNVDGLNWNKK